MVQFQVTKTTNFSYLKDKKDAYYLRLLNYIQHGRLLRSPCILDPDLASEFFLFAHAIYISFGDFLDGLPCKMIYYSLDRERPFFRELNHYGVVRADWTSIIFM